MEERDISQEQFNAKAAEVLATKDEKEQVGIKKASDIPPEERTPEQQAEVDGFTGEVLDAIPGSNQLTPEQKRFLANNLDLSNTKFGAGMVAGKSMKEYIGEGASEEMRFPVEDVAMESSAQLAAPNVGKGQDAGKGKAGPDM